MSNEHIEKLKLIDFRFENNKKAIEKLEKTKNDLLGEASLKDNLNSDKSK